MKKFFVSDAIQPGVCGIEIWASSHAEAAEKYADEDYDMDYSLGHPLFVENEPGDRKKFLVEWDPDRVFIATEVAIP